MLTHAYNRYTIHHVSEKNIPKEKVKVKVQDLVTSNSDVSLKYIHALQKQVRKFLAK